MAKHDEAREAEERASAYVQIGLQQNLFKKEHVKEAERAGQPIHELLLARKVLTPDQHKGLERAVVYRLGRDEDRRVAQLLLEHGYTNQAAIEKALEQQKEVYGKTGELMRLLALLVQAGALTPSQQTAAQKLLKLAPKK